MFRRLAAPLAGIALAVAMPTTASSAAAPVARTACTRATIGGQSKCGSPCIVVGEVKWPDVRAGRSPSDRAQ